MKLNEYLDITDQSVRSFAKKCNLTHSIIHHVLNGRAINLETALIIQKVTNKDVALIDLCQEEFKEKIEEIKSPFKKLHRIK
jgi:hypothetical protein